MNKRVLIIGHTHPESATTGAGKRMIQLIQALEQAQFECHFATTAQGSTYSDTLQTDRVHSIQLNDSSFDTWIKELDPGVVIFDRFMTEEQFGWRVAGICPDALRVLDTEDLHFLRKAREITRESGSWRDAMYSDLARREIACILRSDLSLVISEFEFELLNDEFGVAADQLLYLPYWSAGQKAELPGYEQRRDLVVVGNLLHAPNWDAVAFLAETIWPQLKKQLPEAELHIYGAYGDGKLSRFHKPEQRFHLKGWAQDLSKILPEYRVNLCAVRFGAGLKIKLFDAMEFGLPTVSTPVGAEGVATKMDFPGMIAEDHQQFVSCARRLYTDAAAWDQAAVRGAKLLQSRFSENQHLPRFIQRLTALQDGLEQHRKNNFIIEVLQHQSVQSSKYMSKWIEEKNRNKT